MHRTCTEEIPLNIMLIHVCKTERNGNGYLCMCPDDLCNVAPSLIGSLVITTVKTMVLSGLAVLLGKWLLL